MLMCCDKVRMVPVQSHLDCSFLKVFEKMAIVELGHSSSWIAKEMHMQGTAKHSGSGIWSEQPC